MALRKTFDPETPTRGGLDPSFTTGTGANNLGTVNTDHQAIRNGRNAVLIAQNYSSAAITLTLRAQKIVDGDLAVPNPTAISVPAIASNVPGQRIIGPFDPDVFENGEGLVEFELSAHVDVGVAAIYLP